MKRLIACGIAASIVSVNGLSVLASELNKSDKVNLALNKKTVASSREVNDKWGAELITDGIKDKPSDPNAKPGNSRWASSRSVPQWIYIDFEEATTFDQVDILWDGAYSRNYKLEVSNDGEAWEEVYAISEGKGNQESINLGEDITANYLRVSCEDTAHEWGNVSIYEVEVYDNENQENVTPPETETGVNIALNKTATASASETNTLTPDKVVDGDTSSRNSRWSSGGFSNGAKQWITIDLEKESTFDKVRLFWEAAMKGMLDPVFEEKVLGHAEVRQTFKASGVGTIAGAYVLDGTFERGCSARIIRDGVVIFDGGLASLKRFKDDVKEVKAGYECGFVFEKFNDVKEGDQVESYKMVEIPR